MKNQARTYFTFLQGIRIWNTWGDKLNDIKFSEGFMGQKVGPISSLAFHPFEVCADIYYDKMASWA